MALEARTAPLGVGNPLVVDGTASALADVPASVVLPPNTAMVVKTLTVGTSAVRVRVGGSELTDRRLLRAQAHPLNDSAVYLGASDVDPAGDYFHVLYPGTLPVELPVGPAIAIYAIADAAGQKLPIAEFA